VWLKTNVRCNPAIILAGDISLGQNIGTEEEQTLGKIFRMQDFFATFFL
jgi:hypothetical protein